MKDVTPLLFLVVIQGRLNNLAIHVDCQLELSRLRCTVFVLSVVRPPPPSGYVTTTVFCPCCPVHENKMHTLTFRLFPTSQEDGIDTVKYNTIQSQTVTFIKPL